MPCNVKETVNSVSSQMALTETSARNRTDFTDFHAFSMHLALCPMDFYGFTCLFHIPSM